MQSVMGEGDENVASDVNQLDMTGRYHAGVALIRTEMEKGEYREGRKESDS